jgi:vancomycin permeability regulator SanA
MAALELEKPARTSRWWVRKMLFAICRLVILFALATALLMVAGLSDHVSKADLGLVLGSKVEADGTPSERLRARLDKTVELYKAGCFPLIVASGGIGVEGFEEGTVMKTYLVAHGVPEEQVIVDNDGVTTYASARNAAAIAQAHGVSSILVISQYFHIPRSCLALRRFGFTNVYSAHARYFAMRDFYSAPRELCGFVEYFFRRYEAPAPVKAR